MTRFIDHGDGTITDNDTGLMWVATAPREMRWKEAVAYCEGLNFAGHDDWRLPTIEELTSIVDYLNHNPACDPMLGMSSHSYWSSSTYVYDPESAWLVNFYDGNVVASYKTYYYGFRPVRGGKPEVKP